MTNRHKKSYQKMFNTLNTFTDGRKEIGRDTIMVWGTGESRAMLVDEGLSLVDAKGVSGFISVEDFSTSVEIAAMDCILGGFEFNKHNGNSCVSAVKEITEYAHKYHIERAPTLCLSGSCVLDSGKAFKTKFDRAKVKLKNHGFKVLNLLEDPLFKSCSKSERMRMLMQDMCEADGVAIVSDDYYEATKEKEIAADLSIPVKTVERWIAWKSE